MKSLATLAAIALVGLVLVMMPTGPTYAGQTPMVTSNTPLLTDTVVSTGALLPISPVHWKGYGGYYRGYSGGYWPGYYRGYYSYYPRYYGYYPGFYSYYSYPSYSRYCWWYGGVKYCS